MEIRFAVTVLAAIAHKSRSVAYRTLTRAGQPDCRLVNWLSQPGLDAKSADDPA
jgi:hypothetical protein